MKIKIKNLKNAEKEIKVEISAEKWNKYLDQAISKLGKNMDVKGFRKGKVPAEIVEKKLGSDVINQKGAQLAVGETYPQALDEEDLEPLSQPEVNILKVARGNPFCYKARFAVSPKVKLGNYKGLKITEDAKSVKVNKEDVEESLKHLQKSRASLVTVKRKAQKGDRVEIDFEARNKGVKIEGGESENHPLVLGEGQFPAEFEEKLEGMKEGDEKELSVKFPQDWSRKEFAGKNVDFKVKVKFVQRIDLPKLDDNFARNLGDFKDLKDLRAKLKASYKEEKKQKQAEKANQSLLNQAVANAKVEVSPLLVEREVDNMMKNFEQEVKQMGISFEDYLERIKKDKDELRKNWRPSARKRLEARFVLDEIAEKEAISASSKEVKEEVNRLMKNRDPRETNENLDLKRIKAYTKKKLEDKKTIEFLKDNAKG